MIIVLILFYILFPILLIYWTQKSSFINRVGAVVLAYGFGLLIGNIGVFPDTSDVYKGLLEGKAALPALRAEELFSQGLITASDLYANQIASIQDMLLSFTIPLAIPLLLFSLDLRRWLRLARKTFISLFLALVSVVIVVYSGFFLFRNTVDHIDMVGGMIIGIYTGGTPNVASIAAGLGVLENNQELFIMTNTYDIVIGATCLLLLLTVGQRVIGLVLPPFESPEVTADDVDVKAVTSDIDDYSGMFRHATIIDLLKALGIAVCIFIIGILLGGLAKWVFTDLTFLQAIFNPQMAILILVITSLGLAASLVPAVNRLAKTFHFGMYLIILFCLVVASMANLREMFQIDNLHLFLYIFMVVYGSLVVHVLLSIPFKVDTDTMIISSTAMVYSPPFVPVVAAALKNKDVIISGLTIGILGYVLGNFLGIFTGKLLATWMP
jgi:uncharacterized membrane protein